MATRSAGMNAPRIINGLDCRTDALPIRTAPKTSKHPLPQDIARKFFRIMD
jgi:hypothetical protein